MAAGAGDIKADFLFVNYPASYSIALSKKRGKPFVAHGLASGIK